MTTSFSKHKHPMSKSKFYKKIIHATALGPDLDILPAGDQTEIGEKVRYVFVVLCFIIILKNWHNDDNRRHLRI